MVHSLSSGKKNTSVNPSAICVNGHLLARGLSPFLVEWSIFNYESHAQRVREFLIGNHRIDFSINAFDLYGHFYTFEDYSRINIYSG